MTRKEELKEIIRLNQYEADWGHIQSQTNVINAQKELNEIEQSEIHQLSLNLESKEL